MRYVFQSTGNHAIDKIVEQFDTQIRREIKEYQDSKLCPSYMHKQLFLKNLEMSYDDWRSLRDTQYRTDIISLRETSTYDTLCYKYDRVMDFMNNKS